MKKITLLLIIALCSFQMNAQSKVGTIDVDFIISKMPALEKVTSDIQVYGAELDTEIQTQLTNYQTMVKTYQDNEVSYTGPMKKLKQDEIIKKEQEIQGLQQNSTKLLQLKQNELMRPLYQKLGENLEVIAKEQGFSQVLTINNTIAYLDPNFDVTLTVMKKMGLATE
ncbi:MAG: outer membrane protein [Flavobacteriaceae bacterium]|jgi:outer membrane protein|uniref:OmpH family outer membrane protein n=1 Tax=Candidatus Marifrigoribacter sp. Uisw_064 TaxID=3230970 RepID=UPI003ADBCDA6